MKPELTSQVKHTNESKEAKIPTLPKETEHSEVLRELKSLGPGKNESLKE